MTVSFQASLASSNPEADAELIHEALHDSRSWPLPGIWRVGYKENGRVIVLATLESEERTIMVRTGLFRYEEELIEVVPVERAEEILKERWPQELPPPDFSVVHP